MDKIDSFNINCIRADNKRIGYKDGYNKSEALANKKHLNNDHKLDQEKNLIKNLFSEAVSHEADLKNIRIKFLSEGNRYITAAKSLKVINMPYFNY